MKRYRLIIRCKMFNVFVSFFISYFYWNRVYFFITPPVCIIVGNYTSSMFGIFMEKSECIKLDFGLNEEIQTYN